MKKTVQNPNYCAIVTKISNIIKLDNCDNVVAAIVSGNQVIVQKDAAVGDIGIFFPVECKLSPKFLSNNNLYATKELNVDKEKKGYINDNGRLKCVSFRGNRSEGLFLKLDSLSSFCSTDELGALVVGDEFDNLDGKVVCEKYVPIVQVRSNSEPRVKKGEHKVSRLVEGQFALHCDTENLNKNIRKVKPDDIVSITNKLHGTSAVFAKILTLKKLKFYEKLLKKIGVNLDKGVYDLIYSSRSVIKNKYFVTNELYEANKNDIWSQHAEKVKDLIPDGFTVYGEIVGWTDGGRNIQKGYHYGCPVGESQLYVYRVTYVNLQNKVFELSWGQIKDFCVKYGFKHVPEFYYGKAKDLFPEILVDDNWHSNILEKLKVSFNLEKKCELNGNKVPAEGIVVKVDDLFRCNAFKLKAYLFKLAESKEMDSGEVDIETQESIGE